MWHQYSLRSKVDIFTRLSRLPLHFALLHSLVPRAAKPTRAMIPTLHQLRTKGNDFLELPVETTRQRARQRGRFFPRPSARGCLSSRRSTRRGKEKRTRRSCEDRSTVLPAVSLSCASRASQSSSMIAEDFASRGSRYDSHGSLGPGATTIARSARSALVAVPDDLDDDRCRRDPLSAIIRGRVGLSLSLLLHPSLSAKWTAAYYRAPLRSRRSARIEDICLLSAGSHARRRGRSATLAPRRHLRYDES